MKEENFKSGFVTILGKPNVGKSTILNAIINEKVAIVSPKPQTTRNKIFGIFNDKDSQIIFVDTPGIHKSNNKLDEYMQKSINSAADDADVYILVFDALKPFTERDIDFIKSYASKNVVVVFNKIDKSSYDKLYPVLNKLNSLNFIKDIVPVSGLKHKNIDTLIKVIKNLLPYGPAYYDRDVYTDKSIRFMASEIIREKALLYLNDEVPHGIAVTIDTFDENATSVYIDANIVCEKKSHKQIIIGHEGATLKTIGQKARQDIEKLVDKKVYLNLFVKIEKDWRNSDYMVNDIGYKAQD